MTRILVPLDGTAGSEEALVLAIDLAREKHSTIYALHVIELQRKLPLDAGTSPEVRRGEEILKRGEQVARDKEYTVETVLLQAREAGITIVDEAIERAVDMIVVGMAYKKRFGEFCLGRVAPFILRNAPCRVVISREASVRNSADAAGSEDEEAATVRWSGR